MIVIDMNGFEYDIGLGEFPPRDCYTKTVAYKEGTVVAVHPRDKVPTEDQILAVLGRIHLERVAEVERQEALVTYEPPVRYPMISQVAHDHFSFEVFDDNGPTGRTIVVSRPAGSHVGYVGSCPDYKDALEVARDLAAI